MVSRERKRVKAEAGSVAPLSNASARMIVRNMGFNVLSLAVSALTGLLLTPVLLHHLGSARFGLWALLVTIAGYVGLAELGLGAATVRRVAESRALGQMTRAREVVSSSLALYLCLSLGAAGALAAMTASLAVLVHAPVSVLPEARATLAILGLGQILALITNVYVVMLQGEGRTDVSLLVGMVGGLMVGVTQVLLAILGAGLVPLAATAAAGPVLIGLVLRRSARRRFSDLRIATHMVSRSMMGELLRSGSRNAVIYVCGTVAYGSDMVIIGVLLPLGNVAPYAVAGTAAMLVLTLATRGTDVLIPAYSHSNALDDGERQFRLFSESVMVSVAIAIPLTLAMGFFGRFLLRAWLSHPPRGAYPILIALGISLVFQLPGHAGFVFLTGVERNHLLARLAIIITVINLAISIPLTLRYGPLGPALGSLVANLLFYSVGAPALVCRVLGVDLCRYLRRSIVPVLAPTVVAGVVAWGVAAARLASSPVGGCLASVVTVAVFFAVLVTVGFDRDRRHSYLDVIRRSAVRA